ncbi:MAG: amino acid ABC transporter substrate-binding protein [Bacteriovoracaceae bacterium]|nr:amino acid ABC transporter substrate-binding protein [Bacteriovoracaceae bacterium]
MKKIISSLFLIPIFAIAVVKEKTLMVAMDTTYPPMEFENEKGQPQGFDVDLAQALAEKIGLKVEYKVMPWDGILAGLVSNRYDIIMSSLNITQERKKSVDFIEYVRMGQIFVSKKGSKLVKSIADTKGLIVAAQRDTTSSEFVEKNKKTWGLKDIKTFVSATDAFSALKSKQADFIVIDEPVGAYYANLDKKTFEVTGSAMQTEPIGIAIRKKDKDLYTKLEKALKEIKKEGTYHKIYEKWFGKKA